MKTLVLRWSCGLYSLVAMLSVATWVQAAPPQRGPDRAIKPIDALTKTAPAVASQEEAAADGKVRHKAVLRAAGRYPLVQVDEEVAVAPNGARTVTNRTAYVADHVIVKLKPAAGHRALNAVVGRHNMKIRKKMALSPTYLVETPGSDIDAVQKAIARLKTDPAVEYVEPDYVVEALAACPPDDERYAEMWGLDNTGQTGGTVDADIDAPEAWALTTGSPMVKVGVIDSGIDYTHPDLQAAIWLNPGESGGGKEANGVDDDGNGFIDDYRGWNFCNDSNDATDDLYHGTHVAGTIAATMNNGTGVAGVCPGCRVLPLKFLNSTGSGYTSDAAEAIRYATQMGANLTSNSWGGGSYSQTVQEAIQDANDHGILTVAAAGNEYQLDTDLYPHYPSCYPVPGVIAVGASDHADQPAIFSNQGVESVDLFAPGVNILSAMPTVETTAMGESQLATSYDLLNGTSMATPHVSGVCALAMSYVPGMDAKIVKGVVLNSVDPVAALSGVCATGGRLNACSTLNAFRQPYYLVSVDPAISDSSSGGGSGNGNGILEPGETVAINIPVGNAGLRTASNVTAVLATDGADSYVSIGTTNASYGHVAPGQVQSSSAPFLLTLAAGTPVPHKVRLVLTLSSTDTTTTWQRHFSLTAFQVYQVSGTVLLDGNAVPGAMVHYANIDSLSTYGGYTTTNSAGQYSISVRNPGAQSLTYLFTVTKDGVGYPVETQRVVTVTSTPSVEDFTFGTATVSGQVLPPPGGSSAAGATVKYKSQCAAQVNTISFLSDSITAASNGTYTLRRAVDQTIVLDVVAKKPADGLLSKRTLVTVSPGSTANNVDLQCYQPARFYEITGLSDSTGNYLMNPGFHGINNAGQVVGQGKAPMTGLPNIWGTLMLWDAGTISVLAESWGAGLGHGINSQGLIAGSISLSPQRAFFYNGSVTLLDRLPGATGTGDIAYALNEDGDIAGKAADANGLGRAFLCDHQTLTMYDLGTLKADNSGSSCAFGLSQFAEIVGKAAATIGGETVMRATYFRMGQPNIDLGTLRTDGTGSSEARDINDNGIIVGSAATDTGEQNAFLISVSSNYVPLPPVQIGTIWTNPGTRPSYGYGVNQSDEAVGYCSGMLSAAFIYMSAGQAGMIPFDLNELIPDSAGWLLYSAYDLNDDGVVCGTGLAPDGTKKAFLLTPAN